MSGTVSDFQRAAPGEGDEYWFWDSTYTFVMPEQDLTATPTFSTVEASNVYFTDFSETYPSSITLLNSEDGVLWMQDFGSASALEEGVVFAAMPGRQVKLYVYGVNLSDITVTVNDEEIALNDGYYTFTAPSSDGMTIRVSGG